MWARLADSGDPRRAASRIEGLREEREVEAVDCERTTFLILNWWL